MNYGGDVRKGIVYYTDNRPDEAILSAVQRQIKKAELPIVSVSLQPLADFGHNFVMVAKRGYLTMFKQILAGLEAIDADVIFFCEHDVLYHPCHFDFTPSLNTVYYYNENVYKVEYPSGRAVFYYCKQTSGLCAYRELLIEHYRKRVEVVTEKGYSRDIGFEPGTHNRPARIDDFKAESWLSKYPNIDIRHNKNLTPSRWSKDEFRNPKFTYGWREATDIEGWGNVSNGGIVKILEEGEL
jgi:hypothetical protein